MLSYHTIEIMAREHQQDLLREAAAARRLREIPPGRPVRDRLASGLLALVRRVAPAAPARAPQELRRA